MSRFAQYDPENVVVQLPLRTFKLLDVAAAALRDETNEVTKLETIVLETCVVQWSTVAKHCREDNQKQHQTEGCHQPEARFSSFVERRGFVERRCPSGARQRCV